jgi:hypothetical protein
MDLVAAFRSFGAVLAPKGNTTPLIMFCTAAHGAPWTGWKGLPAPSLCSGSSGSATLELRPRYEHAAHAGLLKAEVPFDHAERMLQLGAKVCLLQTEAVPARAVSFKSSTRPSRLSSKARRLPGRMATRKPIPLACISDRISIPLNGSGRSRCPRRHALSCLSTTGCLSWSGASQDPSPASHSWWSLVPR